MSKVRLTAKEAAERLGVSYVIAAGLLSHLEEKGKAVVVEKRFHESGKGKPTRVYEMDAEPTLNFGVSVAPVAVTPVEETVSTVVEPMIETLDHVAAAVKRLKEAQDADAA